MCREGAWFELTVEVTSVGKRTKPTARFFISYSFMRMIWAIMFSDMVAFLYPYLKLFKIRKEGFKTVRKTDPESVHKKFTKFISTHT